MVFLSLRSSSEVFARAVDGSGYIAFQVSADFSIATRAGPI
jgi:hypothetical protein